MSTYANITTISDLPQTTGRVNVAYHDEYINKNSIWTLMEDAYNNDIKRYAHRYLVAPPGVFQEELNDNDSIKSTIEKLIIPVADGSTWTYAAKAYAAGGFEADLVPRTIKGFISLVGEHAPVMEVPTKMEYIRKEATKDNMDINTLYLRVVRGVLLKGRVPLVLDIHDDQIKIVEYKAESLIDWEAMDVSSDSSLFKYAIFKDVINNESYDPFDSNSQRYFDVYYHHYLDNGVYRVKKITITDSDVEPIEEIITPLYKGKTLSFIPILAIGAIDNTPDVDAIPLVGIANCTTAIYDLSCMLKHAEKTSAVPTMYITGVNPEDAPTVTGAGVCIVLPDYTSKVGYTITDTSAMTHIKNRMADYYMQAQELGASLLGSSKQGSESGEALRLRQASSTATVKSIVVNVGEGFTRLLNMIAEWIGEPKESSFEPNREFSTFALTANDTIALVQTWQAGAISHSTLLENFRKSGMLKAGETVEEEKSTLKEPDEKYVELGGNPGVNPLDVGEGLPKSNTMNKNV